MLILVYGMLIVYAYMLCFHNERGQFPHGMLILKLGIKAQLGQFYATIVVSARLLGFANVIRMTKKIWYNLEASKPTTFYDSISYNIHLPKQKKKNLLPIYIQNFTNPKKKKKTIISPRLICNSITFFFSFPFFNNCNFVNNSFTQAQLYMIFFSVLNVLVP